MQKLALTRDAGQKLTSTRDATQKLALTRDAGQKLTLTRAATQKLALTRDAGQKLTLTRAATQKLALTGDAGHKLTLTRDAVQKLALTRDARQKLTLTRAATQKLALTSDAGQKLTLTRAATQKLALTRDAGHKLTLTRDAVQKFALTRDARQKLTLTRDAMQKLALTRDAGQKLTSTRDATQKLALTRDAGQKLTLTRAATQKLALTGDAGHKLTLTRDAAQKLALTRDARQKMTLTRDATQKLALTGAVVRMTPCCAQPLLAYIEPFVGLLIIGNGVMIVKVFRLKFMKDLRNSQRTVDVGLQHYFETIPNTMFTAFRCFTGECVNEKGQMWHLSSSLRYQVSQVLPWSPMVSRLAADGTALASAQDTRSHLCWQMSLENEAVTAEQYARESIRIARTTRELLKKFAAAHREFLLMDKDALCIEEISRKDFNPMPALFTDDDVHEQIEISKELFLVVIQDRSVQSLMDELDLPAERANLFEVIDADGGGTLGITELDPSRRHDFQGPLVIGNDEAPEQPPSSLLDWCWYPMSSRAAARGLDQLEIERLLQQAVPGQVLPFVHFAAAAGEEVPPWRSVCWLIRSRPGGFMLALPAAEEVQTFLAGESEIDEVFVHHAMDVNVETPRGRALGSEMLMLVDASWAGADFLRKPSSKAEPGVNLIKLLHGGTTVCRPVRDSLEEAARTWVKESMDEDTACEYQTAEEIAALDEAAVDGVPAEADVVAQLQAQVQSLEEQLRRRPMTTVPLLPQGSGDQTVATGAQSLLGAVPTSAAAGDSNALVRLRQIAGVGPTRLAAHERNARESRPENAALAEQTAGALDLDEFDTAVDENLQLSSDPMQRLVLMQMKQMNMLSKHLQAKQHPDAISAALSGGGGEGSGSNSGGIKGCLAREAFLRLMDDPYRVATVVETNALQELGLQAGQSYPGMLRDYLEKRVPLGSYRMLTQVGYMAAAGWEAGFRSGSRDLMAFSSKLMVFVEQTAVDQGKTSLSWLMTGLPDPNYSVCQQNSQRSGLRPFAALAAPSWVAANVSYLKDLDFLEGKIRNQDKNDKAQPSKPEDEKKPKGFPKKRPKAKASPDASQASSGGSSSPARGGVSPSANIGRTGVGTIDADKGKGGQSKQRAKRGGQASVVSEHLTSIRCTQLIEAILQVAGTSASCFGGFLKRSFQPTRDVQEDHSRSDLWPCPLPRWSWTASQHLLPKRRARKRFFSARGRLLQHVVAALNWLTLGHPRSPPSYARLGAPMSSQQHSVLERIEDMLSYFLSAPEVELSDLGRAGEKLGNLLNATFELSKVSEIPISGLQSFLDVISHDMDPYQSKSARVSSTGPGDQCDAEPAPSCSDDASTKVKLASSSAKPVIADRIKWKLGPSFDPRPFLSDPLVLAAYDNPNILRKPESEWPQKPRARVHCSRDELKCLAAKWDALGACALVPVGEVAEEETVGIFAVTKDQEYDRLILNPTVVNSRMYGVSTFTKQIAPGHLITMVRIPDTHDLVISSDDLSEYYYTFKVSQARAARNAIGMVFWGHELSHLSCCTPEHYSQQYYIALSTLAMGDGLAVEIAQQSHCNLLRVLGHCMHPKEVLAYRRAIPRGPFYELLTIDDHIGLQLVCKGVPLAAQHTRDREVFQKAEAAYDTVGLTPHPGKRQRQAQKATVLGAELDGAVGRVGSPRNRVVLLMLCTAVVVHQRRCTRKILQSIIGCWVHALLFRRCIFSVLDAVYHEGQGLHPDAVFTLTPQSINEMLMLLMLGPLAQCNMRTSVCPELFTMDASPSGGAICRTHLGATAVDQLWLHSEQRGYYTKLEHGAGIVLQEKGIEHEDLFGPPAPDPEMAALSPFPEVSATVEEAAVFECLELFRGQGNWSRAHEEQGYKVHPGVERSAAGIRFGDLSDNATFMSLLRLADEGSVEDWHAAPPCWSFGTLRRPRLRSLVHPAGFDPDDVVTKEQTMLAVRTAFLLLIAIAAGSYVSCEQPGSSVMFCLRIFGRLLELGCRITKFCFCSFGSGFNKPSKWLHNKPWMDSLAGKCNCRYRNNHFVVQGTFTRANIRIFNQRCNPDCATVYGRMPRVGEAVSSFSAQYPLPLCRAIAKGKRDWNPSEMTGPAAVDPAAMRAWHEDPDWVYDLCESLPFKELFRPDGIKLTDADCMKYLINLLGVRAPAAAAAAAAAQLRDVQLSTVTGHGAAPALWHRGHRHGPQHHGEDPKSKRFQQTLSK
eukprot:Skav204235  [mRNA]  locus=scaffold1550:277390:299473:- [translate_table: standard]